MLARWGQGGFKSWGGRCGPDPHLRIPSLSPASLRDSCSFFSAAEQPLAKLRPWEPNRALSRGPREHPVPVRVSVPPRSQQHGQLHGHPHLSQPPPRHQQSVFPARPPPDPRWPPLRAPSRERLQIARPGDAADESQGAGQPAGLDHVTHPHGTWTPRLSPPQPQDASSLPASSLPRHTAPLGTGGWERGSGVTPVPHAPRSLPASPSPALSIALSGGSKRVPPKHSPPWHLSAPPPADTEKQQVAGGGPAVTASAMGAGAGTWKSAPENPEDTLRLQPPGKVTMGAGRGDPHGRGSWVVLGHHSLLLGNWAALFPSLDTWPLNQRRAPPFLPPLPPSQSGCPSCSCPGRNGHFGWGGCPIFGVVSGIGKEGT